MAKFRPLISTILMTNPSKTVDRYKGYFDRTYRLL